jgi:hypothetical protein
MERSERSKEYAKQYAKHHRDWLKSLSPEALKEYKQNKIYDKERREDERKRKAEEKVHKSNVKRELTLLKYMLKHDVSYFHHGKEDSMKRWRGTRSNAARTFGSLMPRGTKSRSIIARRAIKPLFSFSKNSNSVIAQKIYNW